MHPPAGLTGQEAATRLAKLGPNEIAHAKPTTALSIFLAQFQSPLVIILLIATAISLFVGDALEGYLILGIVILNALLGFMQEHKAEKALEALKKIAVSSVRVVRDGIQQEIDSKLLVPDDIIFLEEGNKIPADAVLLEGLHLEVDEAALTGESLPVAKSTAQKDELQLFMGTIVVKGRGIAKVIHTGAQTRFGQIATQLSTMTKEETPLAKRLGSVAKQLGVLALAVAALLFVIGLWQKVPLVEILLTSISLAVAAVPEGLPAVITITLAIGTQRMARKRAILRRLAAIEALGSIDVIATDKTGTLTKNEMRVVRTWIDDTTYQRKDKKLQKTNVLVERLLAAATLCNNASLAPRQDHGSFDVVGDKTEGALLLMAADLGVTQEEEKLHGSLLEEFAFDPVKKLMSVLWKNTHGTYLFTKGAPESVLARSTKILTKSGEADLGPKTKDTVIQAFEEFAKEGLRVIALAQKKTTDKLDLSRDSAERNLTFIGFVGIADPPREEVRESIATAETAGIRTIMITGDNELTAAAIARQIGLLKQGDNIITGMQLSTMNSQELLAKLPHIRVFARTTPQQKLTIVKHLQELGHTVAVTGDGVNDALALKQADVGVAMGITGTDVAKEAADMVIADDNYATLVAAVEQGRMIYHNMKSSIKYLIGCNLGEIFTIFGGLMLGLPFIFIPLQLLYINLATDGLPALALALNKQTHGLMRRPPRRGTALFGRPDLQWFAETAILATGISLIAFFVGYSTGNLILARTLAFTTMILVQQFVFLDIASADTTLFSPRAYNPKFLALVAVTMVAQLLLFYVPFIAGLFKITQPTGSQLLFIVIISLVILFMSEMRKRFAKHLFHSS